MPVEEKLLDEELLNMLLDDELEEELLSIPLEEELLDEELLNMLLDDELEEEQLFV